MRPSVGGAGRLAQSEGSRGRGPQLGPAPSSAGVLAAFSQVTACPKLSAQGLAPNPLPALEPPLALPGLRQGLCMAGQPPALSLCPASWESFSETHLAILHPVFPTVTRVPPAYISIVLGGPSASRLADGRSPRVASLRMEPAPVLSSPSRRLPTSLRASLKPIFPAPVALSILCAGWQRSARGRHPRAPFMGM